ncbi:MAG: isoprenylcysteine carboxylmethyltransferase family protein [Actinomycetota bacterium]
MDRRGVVGWVFVGVQAVLLGLLILLPGRDDWPTPAAVDTLGAIALVLGVVLVAAASLRLGRALTATPVPTRDGELITHGLYRYVRHPIYSGVLLAVVGLTIRSGSLITLAVAVTTVVFFVVKATWEEQRLAERYEGYAAYAASTPRFVPRP